jgi:DNA-binding transcriptional LysR family regulator
MSDLEWDDLRFVLAVASAGSLAGAARALGVNHTTVLRRVIAFEKRLGLRLFERLPTGYVLTAGGEELIAAARRVEETITTLERKLAGRDSRLSGAVRITTADTLMASILPAAGRVQGRASRHRARGLALEPDVQPEQARRRCRDPARQ